MLAAINVTAIDLGPESIKERGTGGAGGLLCVG